MDAVQVFLYRRNRIMKADNGKLNAIYLEALL